MRDLQSEVKDVHCAIKSIRGKLESGKLVGEKKTNYKIRLRMFYIELNKLTKGEKV